MPPRKRPLAERFWSHVEHRGLGCWMWTATINQYGYGRFRMDGVFTTAHRVAWTLTHGPIPPATHLDHLCRNRACVNPDHLEPVTYAENARRGKNGFHLTNMCRAGIHDMTAPDAIYVRGDGRRSCRECEREYGRRLRSEGASK